MKRKIATVSEEEKLAIQHLFERKNGLLELAKILNADNTELYEKVVVDLGKTSTEYQNWWDEMAANNKWEKNDDGNWEIDFNSNEIFLVY